MTKFSISIHIDSDNILNAIQKSIKKMEDLISSHHCGIPILNSSFLLDTKDFYITCVDIMADGLEIKSAASQ